MTPRRAYLEALLSALGEEEILVSCLGGNARYLPEMRPRCATFALCDTMGGAIPLALGMALARPERRVTALEGDGALLMNLGTLVTVAAAGPANLTILVFCNRRYESSGGQPLPPVAADFAGIARGTGLAAEDVATVGEFRDALARARARGSSLLALQTAFDPAEPIPPYRERPPEIRAQFADWVRRHP
ncbi:MAG TPA: thiamine pyrophosphate-dependent enzyme [Candidatus Methylomirabilis sp.]|jgi:thiamine pyrophosphate-dependent acetolactate synthase large subunit-like protein